MGWIMSMESPVGSRFSWMRANAVSSGEWPNTCEPGGCREALKQARLGGLPCEHARLTGSCWDRHGWVGWRTTTK